MVQVRGTVHDVSDNPERVERIVVRAVEPRMHGTTYITEESVSFPVVDGVLDFDVLPGPCVVAFLRNHGATTYEKLLVPDAEEATFRECLDAAALAEEGTKSALEKVVRQIQEELNQAVPLVEEVRTLRTDVNESKAVVDGYVKDAQNSAAEAATSETNAKTSETNAASSADSAGTYFNNTVAEAGKAANSAAAAKTSETNAASSESDAAIHESNAAIHETNAGASATAAATSANEAKGHADRAEQATDLTSLRNDVIQQISEVVDGAPGDLDTLREIAEYAQSNRGITDQLNAAIGDKANKSHTHVSADITDAVDHIHGGRAGRLVQVGEHGHIRDGNRPTDQYDLANKMYVDEEVAKKANTSHTHTQAQVTGLDDALAGKADATDASGQTVARYESGGSQWLSVGDNPSWNGNYMNGGALNLRSADSRYASKTHTHSTSQVTGLDAALDGKADKSYVESRPALFSGVGVPPTSISGAVVGDWWLDTSTMELYKITGV